MPSLLGSILRQASRKSDEPLNILTFPTHERYESGLAKTGHQFYAYRGPNIKDWDKTYAPLPQNYILLEPEKEPPLELDFDLILSQNKFGQFPIAQYFSRIYNCPLVSLEHTLPPTTWGEDAKAKFRNMKGDLNVFISEFSIKEWGMNPLECIVTHHGIDTQTFFPADIDRRSHLLSVVNDWINRDWCCGFQLWRQVAKDLPTVVVGKTPGLSEPAKSVEDLARYYQQSSIFLNTSLVSPIPTALLEAMSCGCAIVSTATCMIPEIIQNGVNGFISNDPAELRSYCEILLKNPKIARRIGDEARRTILNKFSIDEFIRKWNTNFKFATQIVLPRSINEG
jgi:hypothetical protein